MKYNFDIKYDRTKTSSVKWNPAHYSALFNGRKDLLPLWVADMDFKVSDGIIKKINALTETGIFGYADMDNEYFDSIIGWYKRIHDTEYKKEEIVFTPGIVPALNYLIQTFTEENNSILIQPPVYYPFSRSIRNNNRKIVNNPLKECPQKGYIVDFADMEKKIKENNVKLFILCNPHNPVGRVWEKEELQKMSEICLKHDVLVISDEIHCDLLFYGSKHNSYISLSEEAAANCVVCNAVSKTFNLAGLQISNIIIRNPELREKYKQTLEKLSICHPNIFAIEAAKGAYNDSDAWYSQMLSYIASNIDFVHDYLKENIPMLSMRKQEGTYLGWIDARKLNLSQKKMEELLEIKAKVALDYGTWFGEEGNGFIRMNLASPKTLIEDALKRIKEAVDSL